MLVSSRFASTLAYKGALAVAVVAAGDWLFFQRHWLASGWGLFALAIAAAALAGRPAILRDRTALAAWLASLAFAGALLLDPSLLAWLLFGSTLGIAILKPRTGAFDDAWAWFQRLVWQTVTSSVLPVLDLVRLRRALARRRARGRGLRSWSLRGAASLLALPVAGTAIFLALFADANPVLAGLTRRVLWIGDFSPLRVMLWAFLLLFAWNALRPRLARNLLPSFDGTGDLPLSGVNPASVTLSLVAFNLLFVAQNAMDIAWLWGLAPLPDGMTFARYAHRGAYPLIATALLAGLFVLVTLRPGSSTAADPRIRALVVAWIAQNMLLVASSAVRTIDYIQAYSLTLLRLAALEWMALVAAGLGFILWRLLRAKSGPWLINANAAALALLLSIAAFVDHGAIVARWNVAHAREVGGRGVPLDLCYLRGLGSSALLPLIELEAHPRLTPGFRDRVIETRIDIRERMRDHHARGWWTVRDLRRAAAADARTVDRRRRPAQDVRDCAGRIVPPTPKVVPPPPIQVAPPLTGQAPR